jgi:adenylate cyclase
VKGYSRLMGENETETVKTLTSYRKIMGELIQQHRGRVIDSPGDNILAEFGSVVDAVQCSVAAQNELKARNAELPENRRMEFRIGVNLGDVIEEENRIYGDGVNIAARLEALADPGGICISKTAFDHIETKLPLGYEYLGEQTVKNIAKPVGAYRVVMEPRVTVVGIKEKKAPSGQRRVSLAIAVIVILLAGVLALWQFVLRPSPPSVEKADPKKMALPLPDKPSIAVLPFANIGADPEQEYFSDGITEDIITNLSKLSALFVVSSNSTFLYKGKQVKIEEVARDLGVRHVLEGSVRRAGGRVRITAQLIDGKTGQHVWADNYDRELKDIFSVQDDVTRKVVSELAVALTASEIERQARKHTDNFEAYDTYLRARRAIRFSINQEQDLKGKELAQRCIELDPNFAGGYEVLSYMLSRSIRFGFSTSPKEDLEKAYELAKKAVSVDETFADAHLALASAYLMKERHDDAVTAAMAATRSQPGNSLAHTYLGFYLHWAGRGKEAVEAIKKGRQLNPKFLEGPDAVYLSFMGFACFTAGFYEEAIEAMKQCIDRYGPAVPRHPFLIASYVSLGREEEARAAAQQLLKMNPNFSLESWKYGRTYKNPEDIERLYGALRKAGLK